MKTKQANKTKIIGEKCSKREVIMVYYMAQLHSTVLLKGHICKAVPKSCKSRETKDPSEEVQLVG